MKFIDALLSAKALPLILMALAMLALAGCLPPWKQQQPLTVQDQAPKQESWCYKSLGHADCYAHPQNTAADRLISVNPPSRQPATAQEYGKAVAADGQ